MGILKDRFLLIILFSGVLIRLVLTPIPGFKFDVDTWFAWAERLNIVGFVHFYSDKVWTGYPPGFLYILGFLGFIKNFLQITPTSFYMLLKLPSILSEIILGFIVYKIIPEQNLNWRKIGLMFVVLNPAFIFNSSIFGQFDGLFSLTLLISVYLLTKKKLGYSSLFWGISFLLKPQAILLSPLFLFYLMKDLSLKNLLSTVLPILLITIIAFFPFFPANPITGPINLVSNLFDFYPYNSIFAYNLWGILGFWVKDNNTFINVTYQNWGYLLFVIFLSAGFFYWRKGQLSIYSLTAFSSLGFFFLLTRMHERYLYPSLVFLIMVSAFKKSSRLAILTGILSIIYFLDLYYVYIYYNQFYLKLPEVIYFPVIYAFTNKYSRLISLFSTIFFLWSSISILKLNHESKKA